jgi:hypothetical protein
VKISPRERRLLMFLAVLAGLLGLRLLYAAATPPGDPTISGGTAAAGPATRPARTKRGRAAELPEEIAVLHLEALDREPRDLAFGRDPFRYGPIPPPPPPPPPSAEELARQAAAAEAARLAAIEAARLAAIPKPPPVTIKYLGSFGPESRRVAVFADESGENLYNARAGEVLEGKFIVDRIGYESVDLKFVDFPDEPARRLPIGG